jgi:hypothetical protein
MLMDLLNMFLVIAGLLKYVEDWRWPRLCQTAIHEENGNYFSRTFVVQPLIQPDLAYPIHNRVDGGNDKYYASCTRNQSIC